jgi:hypothetical protein
MRMYSSKVWSQLQGIEPTCHVCAMQSAIGWHHCLTHLTPGLLIHRCENITLSWAAFIGWEWPSYLTEIIAWSEDFICSFYCYCACLRSVLSMITLTSFICHVPSLANQDCLIHVSMGLISSAHPIDTFFEDILESHYWLIFWPLVATICLVILSTLIARSSVSCLRIARPSRDCTDGESASEIAQKRIELNQSISSLG